MQDEVFRVRMLLAQIDPQTSYQYGLKAKRIVDECGGFGYHELLRFFRMHFTLDKSTLWGCKSACIFDERLKGKQCVMQPSGLFARRSQG
jgi:hypothetical protein